jgi:hypothetical protein
LACLYCGKDIGPFRLLRDREFCTAEHRTRYGKRLGKALTKLGAPEPPPAGIAGFQIDFPLQQGNIAYTPALPATFGGHPVRVIQAWAVSVPGTLGGSFFPTIGLGGNAGATVPSDAVSVWQQAHLPARMPRFEMASVGEIPESARPAFFEPPAQCERWMPVPGAQAAECWIAACTADALAATGELRTPQMMAAAPSFEFPVENWMLAPAAQAAECWVATCTADALAMATELRTPQMAAAAPSFEFPTETWMPAATAQAAEYWVVARTAETLDIAAELRAPRMAALAIAGLVAFEEWMPAATAQAAECWVVARTAETLDIAAELRAPRMAALAIAGLGACGDWMAAPAAQAAESWVAARTADPLGIAAGMRTPRMSLAIAEAQKRSEFTPPAACDEWMPAPAAQAAERWITVRTADAFATAADLRIPQISALSTAGPEAQKRSEFTPPAGCDEWMPAPAAQAAERWITARTADAFAMAAELRIPQISALSTAGPYVRKVSKLAQGLEAEPAEVDAYAVIDGRPALRTAAPALLRFGLHAIDAVAAPLPPAEEPPQMAEAVAGQAASPVESIPVIPAFAAVAIATVPSMLLPETANLLHRPMPLAGAVKAPAAIPVETMPTVAPAVQVPMTSRAALRRPTLAQFQPAKETEQGLALPVVAAGPVPAESMPGFGAFPAIPAIAPAALAMRAYPLQSSTAKLSLMGFREGVAPRAEAPSEPQGESRKPSLEPLSRIAAQPAGTQPERPKPEVPVPGMIPLEYYCHRIGSKPAGRPVWIQSPIGMQMTAFPVRAALKKRFAEYGAAPKRKILPFEEIFAQHKKKIATDGRKRINLSHAGKVAAAIMVGLALWAGNRIAGVAQHAQALRVQVAGAERTVDAEEARRAPQGSGSMSRFKRAIAERAAMEITDTFTSGMAAWGAEGKKYAAGWSHTPNGYVRTGELALFKPSLAYTDYRMEFYGQIEEKGMGWVVRAQDKKNYYAMKFKVVEPGLRPIIAMVHYQVVNGKPGRAVQTPLSVMVHNNEPYHVSVDVRGNRFAAAIEGEQVDSWTDEAPGRGGVGFFSDAGERARLYWMKLSRNQDWLGRMCAYLSGDGSVGGAQTAELWGPEIPRPKPEPVDPRAPETTLPVRSAHLNSFEGPNRAQTSRYRRSEEWIS